MPEGRGGNGNSRGGSNTTPFYNRSVAVGDNNITFATIGLGIVAVLFFTSSTILTGMMSLFGLSIFIVAVIVWSAIQIAKIGIWKSVSMGISFFIAIMALQYFFFTYLPTMILEADMTKWEQVGREFETGIQTNSPIVNQPMNGVVVPSFDTEITYQTPQDNNEGGGVPVVQNNVETNSPMTEQVAPVPINVTPTLNPTGVLEVQLEQAILNNDGHAILEITGQILTINPDHVKAKIWNTQAVTEKIHVDGLENMPQPSGAFMAGVDQNQLEHAYNILKDNGEMQNGYQYTVLDNGANSHVSCNETAILRLDNGLFAGQTFTTQRCLISSIAGSSKNNTVFTVR